MKTILALVPMFLVSGAAYGKDLKCRAADSSNRNRKDVRVTTERGAEIVDPIETQYGDYKITAIYNTGADVEPQTMLTITANDVAAKTINVAENGGYQLLAKDLFVQCWFE